MERWRSRTGQWRSVKRMLAAFAVLAVPIALGGCQILGASEGQAATAQPAAAASPTATEQPPTPTASLSTATPRAVTQATPTQTASSSLSVTQQQAQTVVSGWFDAVAAGDYQRAEGLTTGNATDQTKQIGGTIQSQASQRGVEINMTIQRLDLSPAPQPATGEQAVNAAFTIQVTAIKGPISIPAQTLQGSATFVVQQTSGGPKISDIRNVSGLPGQ